MSASSIAFPKNLPERFPPEAAVCGALLPCLHERLLSESASDLVNVVDWARSRRGVQLNERPKLSSGHRGANGRYWGDAVEKVGPCFGMRLLCQFGKTEVVKFQLLNHRDERCRLSRRPQMTRLGSFSTASGRKQPLSPPVAPGLTRGLASPPRGGGKPGQAAGSRLKVGATETDVLASPPLTPPAPSSRSSGAPPDPRGLSPRPPAHSVAPPSPAPRPSGLSPTAAPRPSRARRGRDNSRTGWGA